MFITGKAYLLAAPIESAVEVIADKLPVVCRLDGWSQNYTLIDGCHAYGLAG